MNDWLEIAAWLVFLLPLASFVLIVAFIRPVLQSVRRCRGTDNDWRNRHRFRTRTRVVRGGRAKRRDGRSDGPAKSGWWLGTSKLRVGIFMDGLTAIMLVVVTGVSLLVQIYSTGYMKDDPGYARYFAYMSFFTASMIGLVVAANVIQLFVFGSWSACRHTC